MGKRAGLIGLALAGLALAPPPVTGADLRTVGDEAAVGKNAVGEECRMRLTEARGDQLRYHRYAIFCEGWTQPSGSLKHFVTGSSFPPEKIMVDRTFQRQYETRLEGCAPPEPTTLGKGWAGVMRRCARREGGWPVVVAAVTTGRRTYGLETFPANLRVLEAAAEVIEGARAAGASGPAGSLSDAIRRAETILGASGTLVGVRDIGAFEELRLLGRRQFYAGNYVASELSRRRVVELAEKHFGPDHGALAILFAQLGNSLTFSHRYPEAQQALDRAEALAQRSLSADDLPQTLTYRAWLARAQGQHAETERWAREAIRVRELRAGPDAGFIADSLGPLALALRDQGRPDEAVAAAERALRIVQKPGDNQEWRQWWEGELHQELGHFYRDLKKYPEARRHYEQAMKRLELLFGRSIRVTTSLDSLGYAAQLEGDHAAALAALRQAAEIRRADRLTRERTRPEDVTAYLFSLLGEARRAPATRAAVMGEAFVAAQLPRDGQTARALQAMAVRVAAGDPALAAAARALQDAARRRDGLRFALGQETLRPPDQRAPAREEALRAQLAEAEQKPAELEEKLQAEFPRYARLAASTPAAVADLAPLLGPNEAVVMTVSGVRSTVVLLLRGGQVHAHGLSDYGREKVRAEVAALRAGLVPAEGRLAPFDATAAHRLYARLLGPLAGELAGVTHLLVSPGGPLLSLPWGVLVTQPPAAGQPPHFLARDMAISVLPTVASLRELRAVAGRSAAPRPFIGFGDPAFGGGGAAGALAAAATLCRRGEPMDPAVLRAMPPLPDTAVELKEIAKRLGADAGGVVLGKDATEARVRATDLSQYRVVAFATHGLLPGELRCQSEPALVLTPPAAASASDDGLLDASEVTQLKLDADWVLLSACNTAGPDGGLGGESLSGLTRAFLYAGARALLVSHWPVASKATTDLTTGLFAEQARDATLGRAEALRRSQLALLGRPETAHPFFWAPFVLVGDGGSGAPKRP